MFGKILVGDDGSGGHGVGDGDGPGAGALRGYR